jgi:hypothetical protein
MRSESQRLPKDRLRNYKKPEDVNGLTCRSQGNQLIGEAAEWHSRRRIPSHFGVRCEGPEISYGQTSIVREDVIPDGY